VVPYSIAKLAHDAEVRGRYVDLGQVWRSQGISEPLTAALTIVSERVHTVIMGDQAEVPNPLEWAKQQACWNRVKQLEIAWPKGWFETLLTQEEIKDDQRTSIKEQRMLNGIQAQTAVIKAGAEFWKAARTWGLGHDLLSGAEAGILEVSASLPNRLPTEKQCIRSIEIIHKLHMEGYQEGLELF
jgi:hypothetical protein